MSDAEQDVNGTAASGYWSHKRGDGGTRNGVPFNLKVDSNARFLAALAEVPPIQECFDSLAFGFRMDLFAQTYRKLLSPKRRAIRTFSNAMNLEAHSSRSLDKCVPRVGEAWDVRRVPTREFLLPRLVRPAK